MRSAQSIDVHAPAQLVFDLAHDVTRWPALLPHYRGVHVVERHADESLTARMVAVRPLVPAVGYGIPVAWRARVWADPKALGLRFRHLGGATRGMRVTWHIEPTDDGCRVTIVHAFDPTPAAWATFVDRLFVRPIASRTLATFKAIAEATAPLAAAKRSAPRRRTNGSI
jgi:ribosome-associated toxin RatA of RatAB toxin-antitoxin module